MFVSPPAAAIVGLLPVAALVIVYSFTADETPSKIATSLSGPFDTFAPTMYHAKTLVVTMPLCYSYCSLTFDIQKCA